MTTKKNYLVTIVTVPSFGTANHFLFLSQENAKKVYAVSPI